jgi:hypothetical protein
LGATHSAEFVAADNVVRNDIGLLSDEQEERRSRERDVELTRAQHSWLCQALDKLEADPQTAQPLADAGRRRAPWHDPNAPLPQTYSRLNVKDQAQVFAESPRVSVTTAAPPRPSVTPTRVDPLSASELSKRVLPEAYHLPERDQTIRSKTIALRTRLQS